MYHMFEFTFLRQQVINVREGTGETSFLACLAAFLANVQASTCSREIHYGFSSAQPLQYSLNPKNRSTGLSPSQANGTRSRKRMARELLLAWR
jgi:hypothetical protein